MCQGSSWITEDRVRVYGLTIATIEVIGLLIWLVRAIYFPGPDSVFKPGSDFRVFWAAAYAALNGSPASVYDPHKIFEVLRQLEPALNEQLAWHSWFYPPTYLLALLPLALLPWRVACIVFVAATFAAYLALIRRIASPYSLWWFTIGFPPVLITFTLGQNSFLTALLAGAALMQMDRRPILAGVCVGLLAIKPHLAIVFPIALIAGGRWRVFWTAAATVCVFAGASISIFGADTALSFMQGMKAARAAVLEPYWPRLFMPTLYVGALNMGASEAVANMLQFSLAVCAAAVVGWIWRRDVSANVRNSGLILATLLTSPHLFAYDLTWLALPIIWMAIEGLRDEWLWGERAMLAFAWISPLASLVPAAVIGANPMPLVFLALLAYVAYRAWRQFQASNSASASNLAAERETASRSVRSIPLPSCKSRSTE